MSKKKRRSIVTLPVHSGTRLKPLCPRLSSRLELLVAGSVFFSALLIYVATLYPTCPGGDSGELIATAHTLGIAHPPGYPLYMLLGKLFSLIPLKTIAWRLNLMSAFFDALAAAVLCFTVTRWRGNLWAGVLAGGMFAFAPLTWTYAVAAEVFALNNFFVAGLLLLCVLYAQMVDGQRKRIVRFAAFWAGLGLTNHHAFGIYAGPVMLWMLWREKREFLHPRELARLTALFVLGLLPYIYLPIAASRSPTVAWGDLTTFDGFLTHVLRRELGTFRMASPTTYGDNYGILEHALWYAGHVGKECFYVGIPLAIVGFVGTIKRTERSLALLLLSVFILYLLVFCGFSNIPLQLPLSRAIQARFWQQSNLIIYLWLGLGASMMFQSLGRLSRLVSVCCLGLVLATVCMRFKIQDQHENWIFRDFARAILEPLPARAVLLTEGDLVTFPLLYFHYSEELRPDVTFVPQMPLTYSWAKHTLGASLNGLIIPGDVLVPDNAVGPGQYTRKDFLDANVPFHRMFSVNVAMGTKTLDSYNFWPIGLSTLILPKNNAPEIVQWIDSTESSFGLFDPTNATRYGEDSWEREALKVYWWMRYCFGLELLNYSKNRSTGDFKMLRMVARTLEEVSTSGTMETPELYKNLGEAYQGIIRYDAMAVQAMSRAWTRFLQLAAPNDPDVPKIRAALAAQQDNNRGR